MKPSLQKVLTGRLFVLGKFANQCFPRPAERLKWLNCRHVPTSFLATRNFNTLHSLKNLQVKHPGRSSVLDCISHWRKCSSTSGSPKSTVKWDSELVNFVEHENEYFHSYLESVSEYQPYFLSRLSNPEETVTLSCESVAELLLEVENKRKAEKLLLLLRHWAGVSRTEGSSILSNPSFSQTVRLLQKYIKLFSAEDILQSMIYLNDLGLRWSMSETQPRRNRIMISKAFDLACVQHIERMEVKDLLLAADFFYSVRGSSFADFNFLMCQRMKLFLPIMTKQELIVLMFHASMTRKTPANLVQTVLDHLRPNLKSLTLQELAIVNLAHYKTQSLVKQPAYFAALTGKLKTAVCSDVDPICLSAVLKYQHRSLNRRMDQLLPQFFSTVQDIEGSLTQQVPKLNPETMMRVFRLYNSLDLLSEDLFMAVIDRITHQGVHDWRLKDITKVVHILTNIPLGCESKVEALETILEDLQRKERGPEVNDHPECLLQIAVSLSFCGLYPHWLVEKVFGPSVQKYFKDSKIDYRQDLYHLSQSLIIEDSSYQGPLLQADRFPRLSKNKVYSKLAEERIRVGGCGKVKSNDDDPTSGSDLFHRDVILLDLMHALGQAHPSVTPVPTFLLPHFHTADVEVQHYQGSTQGHVESAHSSDSVTDKHGVREAVVLHASNAYQTVRYHGGSAVPLLRQYHAMRARQLRAMGTTVVEVPHFEFEASTDKSQYLLMKFQQECERSPNS